MVKTEAQPQAEEKDGLSHNIKVNKKGLGRQPSAIKSDDLSFILRTHGGKKTDTHEVSSGFCAHGHGEGVQNCKVKNT